MILTSLLKGAAEFSKTLQWILMFTHTVLG